MPHTNIDLGNTLLGICVNRKKTLTGSSLFQARLALAISQLANGEDFCDLAKIFQELLVKLAKESMMISGSYNQICSV